MIHADKIDMVALKAAVKELNDSGILEEKLKVIGVGKESLASAFGDAVDGLSDEAVAELSASVTSMYETLFNDEVAAEPAKKEKPAKEAKPEKVKAEKAPKEPKAPKEKKESTPRASVAKIMICGANSNMGLIESHVLSSKGISDEEAKALRPDWRKMLKHWKDAGFIVELIEGRYYCKGK